ncbi:hypothetical protein DdX_15221 [Ditylenchus destructor]|uniref:Uncharacterized protein n=1 Tax=Ditylenchus destructor TaxID=166010 RepID=A0AAD4R114_9BILA|nr:hypothetical protein DdX_15221 [Ditylenchus destructor]
MTATRLALSLSNTNQLIYPAPTSDPAHRMATVPTKTGINIMEPSISDIEEDSHALLAPKISELTDEDEDSLWLLGPDTAKNFGHQTRPHTSSASRFPVLEEDKNAPSDTNSTGQGSETGPNKKLTTIAEDHWFDPEIKGLSHSKIKPDPNTFLRVKPTCNSAKTLRSGRNSRTKHKPGRDMDEKWPVSAKPGPSCAWGPINPSQARRGSDSANCDCTALAWAAFSRKTSTSARRRQLHRLSITEDDSYRPKTSAAQNSAETRGVAVESVSTDSGLGSACSSSLYLQAESASTSRSGSMTSQVSTGPPQTAKAQGLPPICERKPKRRPLGWLVLGSMVKRWLSNNQGGSSAVKNETIAIAIEPVTQNGSVSNNDQIFQQKVRQ